MNQPPPFVPSNVADRLVREAGVEERRRGSLLVALQLDHSMTFVMVALVCGVVGGAVALWHSSWTPAIVAVVFATFMYYKLFVSTAREVAQAGILPELQAAYKRLYYSDADFKKQVDDLRASKK